MPRTIDYPRASLARCLELAGAVHAAGDDCTLARAAERLGARPGGTFNAIVSAARRYGFVSIRRGRLQTAPLFRAYRLAYDAPERERVLAESIANVPLFRALLVRYSRAALPASSLARVLVREHAVAEASAERVAGYFVEALRAAGLLVGNVVRELDSTALHAADTPRGARSAESARTRAADASTAARTYRVHVSGPGIDSHVDVRDADDLELVRALVAKIARALNAHGSAQVREAAPTTDRRDARVTRD